MENPPTIGAMRTIERRSGMHIPALAVLFNHGHPPEALAQLVSEYADVQHAIGMRNFLLEGIGFYEYGNQALPLNVLRKLQRPDWLDMFRTYVGMMGHSAQEFWQITLEEYLLAVEGFCLLHRITPSSAATTATARDLHAMIERFPDNKKSAY
ncbi:MAG: hypothetical protein AB7F82_07490 [Alphaproteobacteria bacterium]